MADNRQARHNAVSNPSADNRNIEEAILRLKIHDNQDGGGATPQPGPYPDRPGEPDCIYYLRTGLCGYGNNCRFNHPAHIVQGAPQYGGELPERAGQPDCGFFLKTGTCKYGSTCKYHHPKDRYGAGPVSFNLLNLPMRQDEKSCPYYMRTGSCKFGVACKFHHPQPPPIGSPSTAYGSGSSIAPSSGLQYAGGVPAWSGPRGPYVPGPRLPIPPSYMPVVLSPTQGIMPAQGWNTYVGNLSPLPSTGILGSNVVYNSRNQGDFNSTGQMHLLLTSGSNLPERPDQPECRYFMNNGTCKYGSDCKYHHPKERTAQISTNTLGPLGLPLRPGQAVCSNYSMYGICKYGPSCKFDHPFAGYPYNYSVGMPALSMMDTSLMTYQKNMSLAYSSESSPSNSAKASDWIQKPNSVVKDQNSDKKSSEDPQDRSSSPPPSGPCQDQSD